MRKIFSALSVFAIFAVATPSFSLAQTTGAGVQAQLDLIANLTKQIQALQQQILLLQQQQQQATAQLVATLALGAQGDQVTILQTLLAADAAIYPEGLITGYYGRLTAEAVKRFQKKNGIEQVGIVGPKTLKQLNSVFGQYQLVKKSDDGDDDKEKKEKKEENKGKAIGLQNRLCVIVPPGHLIAPGWLRQIASGTPIIAPCQVLPPGIAKKLGNLPTSTIDVTAPVISAIASSVTTETATVTWTTNEAADSQVLYGATASYGSSTVLAAGLVTAHSQTLAGLTAGTTYHFQVKSKDAAGNLATSADGTFTTATVSDTTAPVISAISVSSIGTTNATVNWTTNEAADSQVSYGTTTAYGTTSTLNATLAFTHIEALTGLSAGTTYHFQVRSKDSSGNLALSSDQTFTTTVPADTTAPVISALSVSAGSSTSTISWTTDEVATGKVYYGTTTPLGLTATSTLTIGDGGLITSHTFNLTGLSTSTTYYYVAESADAAVNRATSTEQSFTTNP